MLPAGWNPGKRCLRGKRPRRSVVIAAIGYRLEHAPPSDRRAVSATSATGRPLRLIRRTRMIMDGRLWCATVDEMGILTVQWTKSLTGSFR